MLPVEAGDMAFADFGAPQGDVDDVTKVRRVRTHRIEKPFRIQHVRA